ncbi:T9SS type A sorting domain-containing protein [Flavobacteriaceae bacterium]|nr:T9SS type A sorting domain-containing protein [Flavobacteriaceae bacterium]
MNKLSLVVYIFWAFLTNAQNQLPIANAALETIEPQTNSFSSWSNLQTNGGQANYSIETENLISVSTKAQKSEIIALGTKRWHVKTHSDYLFQVEANETYIVRFWAKANSASATLKVVFQSEVSGSYQGVDQTLTQQWQQYTHSFTIADFAELNRLSFWYMSPGITYYLDQVDVVAGQTISFNSAMTYQTVDGFGAGIKRRTEHLYTLEDNMREQIETYAFKDLEANMIRFFVYHDLEDPNDNNNAFVLNSFALNWTRYDSNPSANTTKYIGEALNNAFDLSANGFDHVIGNCNSGPAWLKTNGIHNNGGTLIAGGEDEYSEFLVAFINGMQSRYGVGVTAISPTNEPDYDVTYESMNTTPSELSSIISNLDTRLTSENLSGVQIISPETFRVSSNNATKSTTNYINTMFGNPNVVAATDIVATHTYQNPITPSDWSSLDTAALDKPIWVTEAGNLHSPDWDMEDASYHIDRIMDGFNYGGLTAYMLHLFYERHKYQSEVNSGENYGSSALVLWDNSNNIILPKRYHVFKHFANLVKTGFQRIHLNNFDSGPKAIAFKSPDESKIVAQLYSDTDIGTFEIEIPQGTTSIKHYITSNAENDNFRLITTENYDLGSNYISSNLSAMSMHSYVFTIDTSLSSQVGNSSQMETKIMVFPNPTNSQLELSFPLTQNREIRIHNLNGALVFNKKYKAHKSLTIDVKSFAEGMYLIKSITNNGQQITKFLIGNQ